MLKLKQLFFVLCSTAAMAGDVQKAMAAEPEWDAIPGPVVLLFNDALGGLDKPQFGPFRSEEAPRDQFIEQKLVSLKVPGTDQPLDCLALLYNVSAGGAYNGFWVKLGNSDLSSFKDGELVLRLRRLDPSEIQRTVKLGQPDTACTTNFKLELKTVNKDGSIRMIGLRQRIREAHRAEQKAKGYFDLRVPLADFLLDLEKCSEICLVFENSAFLASEYRGGLAVRGIVLTTQLGQNVDNLLAADKDK